MFRQRSLKRLGLIAERVDRGMQQHPFLMGRRTVYGVMPDWNPAEIVVFAQKPLALSLYRDLVTDNIWAIRAQLRLSEPAKLSFNAPFPRLALH